MKSMLLTTGLLSFIYMKNVYGACKNYGDGKSNCPKDSPCCFEGYCNSNAGFCILGNCEPANSYSPNSCWAKPHCKDMSGYNFPSSSDLVELSKFNDPNKQVWYSTGDASHASITGNNLVMQLKPGSSLTGPGEGSTVYFTRWVDHGTFTARIKSGSAAPGVVTSMILRNEFGDEIDFEWVGKTKNTVQTNYYYDDELDFTKMVESKPVSDTSSNYHDYTIQWNLDSIQWLLDGSLIRTVNRADTWDASAKMFKFPDREARFSFSIWDGGNTGQEGTANWAGSPTPYTSSTVYSMYVSSVTVKCLYGGNDTYSIPGSSASSTKSTSSSSSKSTQSTKSSSSTSASSSSSRSGSNSASGSDDGSDSDSESDDTSSPSSASFASALNSKVLMGACVFLLSLFA
ncbi:putative glycosidase crf2 [Zancudomyces culisetae]|uniref:Putative glycosidase crf2 n=1 Tax=Zancudomyces culisetae TaxID=1213189 RepID=A0A1R1PVF5_ZANCU|nr:putative glycosidase crf2 [Zancudomyces culisetae]|eukprot:OMH84921.1 putative glycosidase crf2 [Zancudomyces culisetae]